MLPLRRTLVVALLLASPALLASEQEKARACFERGMALYAVERWDAAIHEFEAGFLEQPLPSFLYNIGQAHQQAGRPGKAVAYYQKYLDLLPNAPDRADVERKIAELRAPPAPPPVVAPPAPEPAAPALTLVAAPAEPAAPPIYKRWWLWTAAAAVVVVAAVIAAIAVVASRPSYPTTDLGFYPFNP